MIYLASDLKENLTKSDRFEAEVTKMVDDFILQKHLNVPQERLPQLRDGYEAKEIKELNLGAAGITSIVWAMGYEPDFSLVKLPVFDNDGFPVQNRGETDFPGLYFLGLPWLHKQKSGLLLGVGEDADYVAGRIDMRPS
jgi:putative flavoprotein involved in K+ transport